jgi:hypothetical protein
LVEGALGQVVILRGGHLSVERSGSNAHYGFECCLFELLQRWKQVCSTSTFLPYISLGSIFSPPLRQYSSCYFTVNTDISHKARNGLIYASGSHRYPSFSSLLPQHSRHNERKRKSSANKFQVSHKRQNMRKVRHQNLNNSTAPDLTLN